MVESFQTIVIHDIPHIYGHYYKDGQTKTCYIAPEIPVTIRKYMAAGYILRPHIYRNVLEEVFNEIIEYLYINKSEELKAESEILASDLVLFSKRIKEALKDL